MSKKYTNPPVVEAVCEIRFTRESKMDLTVPGLIYEKVKKDFPLKEQRVIREGNRVLGELAVFLSEDHNSSIQVGPGPLLPILSITRQKPYTSWHEFKPRIEEAINALRTTDGVKIDGIQRIGLFYANFIEIPESPIRTEDYFNYGLDLREGLPTNIRTFLVGSEFIFEDGRDVCRTQLASAITSKPNNFGVRLDFDYYLTEPESLPLNDVMQWVENAHQRIEEIFEACITDRLRELFVEIK